MQNDKFLPGRIYGGARKMGRAPGRRSPWFALAALAGGANDGKRQRMPRKKWGFKNHANIEKGENREIREPRSWRRNHLVCSRISYFAVISIS
jgi:hypothetical protein